MNEYRKNGNGVRANGSTSYRQTVRATELIPLALVEDLEELEKFEYALQRNTDGEVVIEDDAVRVAKSYKIRFQIKDGLWKPLSTQPNPADM